METERSLERKAARKDGAGSLPAEQGLGFLDQLVGFWKLGTSFQVFVGDAGFPDPDTELPAFSFNEFCNHTDLFFE